MTELPCSILLSPLNRISCGKASSPWGQLEGCVEKLNITKVAFIERLSTRILHNGCIERGGLCGLQVCITARRKMTNMVCRRLYCQTSVKLPQSILTSRLLTEMFVESVYKKRRLRHLDCVDHSILSFMQSIQTMPQVLWHKPHAVVLNIVVVSTANAITKACHVSPRL